MNTDKNLYATKLNLTIDFDFEKLTPKNNINEDSGYRFYSNLDRKVLKKYKERYSRQDDNVNYLEQFEIDFNYQNQLMSIFPSCILEKEKPRVLLMYLNHDGDLPPHIDFGISCGVNYYIKIIGEEQNLVFYKFKNPQLVDMYDPRYYFEEFLDEVDRFVPKENEFWLLNNQQIHSVINKSNTLRKMLCFNFNKLNYYQVLEMFLDNQKQSQLI